MTQPSFARNSNVPGLIALHIHILAICSIPLSFDDGSDLIGQKIAHYLIGHFIVTREYPYLRRRPLR